MCWNMCSFGIMCQVVVFGSFLNASFSKAMYWLATLWPNRGSLARSFDSMRWYASAKNLANLLPAGDHCHQKNIWL